MNLRPFTIAVEGNIGSGKSTFLSTYESLDGFTCHSEPVGEWTDVDGFNVYEEMYKNPEKLGYVFQSLVVSSMVKIHHAKMDSTGIKMMERSIWSVKNVFNKYLFETKSLDSLQYTVMNKTIEHIATVTDLEVDLIVYIRSSPEVAYARMKSRARPEEDVVPIEYCRAIHALHEDWLLGHPKVLVVDSNQDKKDCPNLYKKIEDQIRKRRLDFDVAKPYK